MLRVSQKILNYMRRNRNFRVGDVMVITDVSPSTLRRLLCTLSEGGHLRITKPSPRFREREYLLLDEKVIL